ncbi:MAG: hypothetical protein WC609_01950 [Candidatus Paceibacterota bacterium]|jgi:hypothetical protein
MPQQEGLHRVPHRKELQGGAGSVQGFHFLLGEKETPVQGFRSKFPMKNLMFIAMAGYNPKEVTCVYIV